MFPLIRKLKRTGLLTLVGLLRLLEAIMTTGINLMALLRVAAKLHPRRTALVDERERLTYKALWQQSELLAMALHRKHGIQGRQKVAIACRSHAAGIKAIFAASRLGAHVFLINPEMSPDQLLGLADRLKFDFYVYDEQLAQVFERAEFRSKCLPTYHPTHDSIDKLSSRSRQVRVRLKKVKTGNIIVMTGGTTGQPKAASRKPSILDFFPPFVALLCQVHLDKYQSVYIATPIYHGFGLASLFIGIILGAEMYVTRRFDAAQSCSLIAQNRIEVVTLVPLMLQRMLKQDANALAPLRCIITGGALLSPALARESLERLGPMVFNLYGTSEAGFCIMATPDVLARKPESIGRPVQGVGANILNDSNQVLAERMVGRLCIRSTWTTSKKSWVETGDLAFRDTDGDIFLCGRVDDMIVSGGENVYPVELENVLIQHPEVESVAVIGIPDKEFGQRLKAVVVGKKNTSLDQATLHEWLKPRVARYQMPAVIEFRNELPYTAIGKVDKKLLRGAVM
jgi:acyl-CoA synthetase (AMP-forming)/AMP-acid ligase II